jgi:hypothetical protein
MATKVGTTVLLKIDTDLMVGEISTSLAMAINAIDVSSKASGRASNYEYGRYSETMSISSIASTDSTLTTANFVSVRGSAQTGTKVAVEITEYSDETGVTPVAGAHKIAGTAVITSVTWDVPDNDRQTFSIDLQFDGDTTSTINT